MKVSQKAEYAFRAMVELAQRTNRDEPVRTAEIARRQRIPEKFLELILVELRRAGLILSQRGPIGGHRLARAPNQISVGDIWRAVDSALGEPAVRSRGSADPFHALCTQANRASAAVMDSVSLDEMRRRTEAKDRVPDFNI